MKKIFLTIAIAILAVAAYSQKKTTTSAVIAFDATTSIDNLPKAENKTAIAAIDPKKGTVQFEAAIKNFAFSNPTIQEHFNQKGWMDSDTYPKASFTGNIVNLKDVNFKKDGRYNAQVEGVLTIRGQEQKIKTPATIEVANGTINASTSFTIKLEDFGVTGKAIAAGKVSKEPTISVTAELK